MPADTASLRIGEAAQRSGVSTANIRYYEKEALLAPGPRSESSYRLYSDADIHQLRFIRQCRAMDMSLGEVRTLLALDRSAAGADHTACDTLDEHLSHVRIRLQELKTLERDLIALRRRCDGTDGHCHVIDALHERADAEPVAPPGPAPAKRHV
ncbi:MerR family transcriptional regulator [Acidovorax sp.]|uniref:MerR family transcriptional regulator n=1 Tax=Acidovorax sp. TaxID=1872122 RepID=UPI002ACD4AA5|nr:MerR family transcriptional regulator [Acidovorax sp.]MDZ7864198.1 MerR family transcriptional regulator [Acidovorax sp.]